MSLDERVQSRSLRGYRLQRSQVVGGTLSEVFAFFKDPYNLEAITPPWLGFRILEATDREVRLGTRIRYDLRLHGIPLRWESRIAEYADNSLFADEQVTGPYRRWYHRHLFREVPGGVAIEDAVDYELPLGALGRIAHAVAVRRQLRAIFDHRARAIGARFPLQPAQSGQAVLP
jgi:ligand-binding SRPBCC domain-containing protein